jgi:S1-C subfamily serine protease
MPPSLVTAAWAAWRAAHLPLSSAFPVREVAGAIVKLGVRVPGHARTAETLGTEREGTGAVIGDGGLILTIGYLLLEAASILVIAGDGRVLPADVAGFDHATGFGLVRTTQPLGCEPLEFGDSTALAELHSAFVVTHAAAGGLSCVSVAARRPFTGWWEYALDNAIFTAPARDHHSGAALLDVDGRLLGIGSLFVGDVLDAGAAFPGNMFVPIDLLPPILGDLQTLGRRRSNARPWLGVYSEELRGHVVVTQTLPDSPAARAGLQRGDVVLAVGNEAIGSLAEFYRLLWASGSAGAHIALKLWRNNAVREVVLRSIDRMEYLRY